MGMFGKMAVSVDEGRSGACMPVRHQKYEVPLLYPGISVSSREIDAIFPDFTDSMTVFGTIVKEVFR